MGPTTKEEMDVVLANNKLIGQFMNLMPGTYYDMFKGEPAYSDYPWYNQDWNRLMKVWKLIRDRFRGLVPQIMLMDQASEFHSAVDNGDIAKAYKAVVDAVNLYNSKIKQ